MSITAPTGSGGSRRWPTVLAVVVGLVAVVVIGWLLVVRVLLGDDAGSAAGPTVEPSPVPTAASTEPTLQPTGEPTLQPTLQPTGEPSPSPVAPQPSGSETTGTVTTEPVTLWFAGEHEDTLQNPALYPETVDVTVPPGSTTAQAAVDALLSTLPVDPDYSNAFWDTDGESSGRAPATATVSEDASGTVVDLPGGAFGIGVGSAYAELGVQQVINTVLSNGAPAPVTLTVDGQAGAEVWGVLVLEPSYELDEQVWTSASVTSLLDGSTTGSPVTLSGVGSGFEGELDVLVLDEASGDVVEQAFVVVSGGAVLDDQGRPARSPYLIDLDLGPGTFRLVVADGNEGDEGPRWVSYDDKVVTVE